MHPDVLEMLSLRRLPGRLSSEQAAPLLGFKTHDIPILIRAKLLKPIGHPPANAVKFFTSADIEKAAKDHEWLHRATKALYVYWDRQNQKRRGTKTAKSRGELLAA